MICNECKREGLSEKELAIHMRYFHRKTYNYQPAQAVAQGVCPECESTLMYQNGCVNCSSCGFSRCE